MLKTPYNIGRRNTQINQTHWESLDPFFTITKPTIICLGGNGTKGSEQANHICKVAQSLIGLKDKTFENEWPTTDDVDLIGISYGEEYLVSTFGKKSVNKSTQLTNKEREAIVHQLFTPLLIKNGQRFSTDELLKNMSLLTFFSFCQGANETKQFITRLEQHMLFHGYTLTECEQALNQIVSVSYAPSIPVPYVKRFDIKSLEDQYFSYGHEYERDTGYFEGYLTGNTIALDNPDKYFPYTNGMTLYSDKLANNYPLLAEHRLSIIERNLDNWQLEANTAEGPVYMGENADKASQCAGYVLATSVANGLNNQLTNSFIPKPEIPTLFEDCCKIIGQQTPESAPTLSLAPTYASEK